MAFEAVSNASLPATPTMIDVGAHFGGSMGRFLRDGWDVWAFEPDPANRRKLFERLVDGEHMPRRVDKRAVAETSGDRLDFFVSPVSAGISTLRAFHDTHEISHEVTTVRLDDFMVEQAIDHVDYLKIDIEGFDFFALQGFPFASIRPKAVLCEFEDRKTLPLGYSHHDLGMWLKNLGYQVLLSEWHPIVEYGEAHSWCRIFEYQGEILADDAWGNFLCFDTPLSPAELDRLVEEAMQERSQGKVHTATPARREQDVPEAQNGDSTESLDEIVELLHQSVMTLARHDREIQLLNERFGPNVNRADLKDRT